MIDNMGRLPTTDIPDAQAFQSQTTALEKILRVRFYCWFNGLCKN